MKKNKKVMFVDDEESILASFIRICRKASFDTITVTSGVKGLLRLEHDVADIVISDMRMPEMSGTDFLAKVAEKWPDTIRILITGEANHSDTIEAINSGKIWHYINKPFDEKELVACINKAFEFKSLQEERNELLNKTHEQNKKLKHFNEKLNEKVKSRTESLTKALSILEETNRHLKAAFFDTIKLCTNILEARNSDLAGYSRKVADIASKIAKLNGMSEDESQQVLIAGLLHEIGKIGMSDELIDKPQECLNTDEMEEYLQLPTLGAGMLLEQRRLQHAASYIASHRERWDGSGVPTGIKGNDIPLGARILSVASDYCAMQVGMVFKEKLTKSKALEQIKLKSGESYDPAIVICLEQIEASKIASEVAGKGDNEEKIQYKSVDELEENMVIEEDLRSPTGRFVLLHKGQEIDLGIIKRLKRFQTELKSTFKVAVKCKF